MAITSATISVRDLHRAQMLTEDTPQSAPIYAEPSRMLTEAVNVTITPTAVSAQGYGDGGTAEAYEGSNGGTIAMQIHSLSIEDAVALFGEVEDANGVKITSDNDYAPYTAIGFVTDKGNGSESLNWLYKVKMQKPAMNVNTKTNTVTFQQPTINGTYIARKDKSLRVNNKDKDMVKAQYDSDGPNFKQEVSDNWFKKVYDPVAPVMVTAIAVNGAAGVTDISTKGGTLQMQATITPDEATNKNVLWSVLGGSDIATISQTGLLTAVGDGTATVVATARDGSGISGEVNIAITGQT